MDVPTLFLVNLFTPVAKSSEDHNHSYENIDGV